MAYGDPMVLQTIWGSPEQSLLVNGPFELWSNVGLIATGWDCSAGYTKNRIAGTRTGGSGDYYQMISRYGLIAGNSLTIDQTVSLPGSFVLPARGHLGSLVNASIWLQGGSSALIAWNFTVTEYDNAGGSLALYGGIISITTSWQEFTLSFNITHSNCASLKFTLTGVVAAPGDLTYLYLDDAKMYFTYTFAANPSMPDQQGIVVPGRVFGRTIAGDLYRGRGASASAKFQKTLNFGLIGLSQMEALRSLWLLDVPCRWTPNQPHLPSSLDVRLTDDQFNFTLGRGSFGSNIYRGSLELSEI